MDFFTSLNDAQSQAVQHTDGPLLILAGAGSGKTRVITHRIAHLIHNKGIAPYRIFAVTFTNKAAEEMKNRVISLIGPEGNSVFMKTFHSAAVYILRRYGHYIGIEQNFSIYDQNDQAQVIKEILTAMRLDPKKVKPASLVSQISGVKDRAELIDGTDLETLLPSYYAFDFSDVYKRYHTILRQNNALDFNDLLIKTVELFRQNCPALEELQKRWTYFMIDEYQDTNYAQYLIANDLSSRSRNICVVGDDDQSIYSWRGADIRNILRFEDDHHDARVVTLNINYRSTSQILESASSVISNNINRKEKDLTTFKDDGENIVWCQTNNEYGEAEYVINTVISLKYREKLNNRDFAIFYRTNAQSRLFEDQLRKENIPYRVVGGLKFYDRKEIKDMLAYLKFIANPHDSVSLMRIINTPARGIGPATVERIRHTAAGEKMTEWEVISKDMVTGRVPKGLDSFKDMITHARTTAQNVPATVKLSDFVHEVFEMSGYRRDLTEDQSVESASRIENIEEFINSVYAYEQVNREGTLEEFLQDISLFTSEENPEDPELHNNALTLMTVHNAKGLEFPVVFLTGMEENTFPHRLSIDTEEGLEEERRLCYVGITRAMERLYMTNADIRRTYGGIEYKEPSRFLMEIPPMLVDSKSYYADSYGEPSYRARKQRSFSFDAPRETTAPPAPSAHRTAASDAIRHAADQSRFKKRDRVMHPKYGPGQIIGIEGSGDNLKLTVLFGTSAKTFLEKYTPLEKIS